MRRNNFLDTLEFEEDKVFHYYICAKRLVKAFTIIVDFNRYLSGICHFILSKFIT